MKFTKPFMLLAFVIGMTAAHVHAQTIGQETRFDRQLRERDEEPVREFVESKENIDIKDKAKNLDISGDVRFEYRSIREKGISYFQKNIDNSSTSDNSSNLDSISPSNSSRQLPPSVLFENYRYLRGGDHVDARGLPLSNNDFDVEFNFKVKYSFERAWCSAHLQFDNPAGCRGRNDCANDFVVFNKEGSDTAFTDKIRDTSRSPKGSGEGIFLNLKRAFMGYNVYANGKQRFDIEIGRRKLDDVFVSEVEFSSRFDGILLKYANRIDQVADWYCNSAVFVIDERVNHFGAVTEIGFLNVADTGLDLRYSYIDWRKCGRNRCFVKDAAGSRFRNSQISFAYTFTPEIYCYKFPVEFYGGILVNHAAKKHSIYSRNKRKNLAWYAGAYIGNVDKKGDWALDIEYIVVQAQAVSDFDVGSVGRGNILDENLTDKISQTIINEQAFDTFDLLTTQQKLDLLDEQDKFYYPRRGNANFVGFRFEGLYALTDNLSVDMIYEFSNAEDRHIGGRHFYSDFEIEMIYAF